MAQLDEQQSLIQEEQKRGKIQLLKYLKNNQKDQRNKFSIPKQIIQSIKLQQFKEHNANSMIIDAHSQKNKLKKNVTLNNTLSEEIHEIRMQLKLEIIKHYLKQKAIQKAQFYSNPNILHSISHAQIQFQKQLYQTNFQDFVHELMYVSKMRSFSTKSNIEQMDLKQFQNQQGNDNSNSIEGINMDLYTRFLKQLKRLINIQILKPDKKQEMSCDIKIKKHQSIQFYLLYGQIETVVKQQTLMEQIFSKIFTTKIENPNQQENDQSKRHLLRHHQGYTQFEVDLNQVNQQSQIQEQSIVSIHMKSPKLKSLIVFGKFKQFQDLLFTYKKRLMREKVEILKRNSLLSCFTNARLMKIVKETKILTLKKYAEFVKPCVTELSLFLICEGQIQKIHSSFEFVCDCQKKTKKAGSDSDILIENQKPNFSKVKKNITNKNIQTNKKHDQNLYPKIKTLMEKGQFLGDDEILRTHKEIYQLSEEQRIQKIQQQTFFNFRAKVKSQKAVILKFSAKNIIEGLLQYEQVKTTLQIPKQYYSQKQIIGHKRFQSLYHAENKLKKLSIQRQFNRIQLSPQQKEKKKLILKRYTEMDQTIQRDYLKTNSSLQMSSYLSQSKKNSISTLSQKQIQRSLNKKKRLFKIKSIKSQDPSIQVFQSYHMKNKYHKNQVLSPLTVVKNCRNRFIFKPENVIERNITPDKNLIKSQLYQMKSFNQNNGFSRGNISLNMYKVQKIIGKRNSFQLEQLNRQAKLCMKGNL